MCSSSTTLCLWLWSIDNWETITCRRRGQENIQFDSSGSFALTELVDVHHFIANNFVMSFGVVSNETKMKKRNESDTHRCIVFEAIESNYIDPDERRWRWNIQKCLKTEFNDESFASQLNGGRFLGWMCPPAEEWVACVLCNVHACLWPRQTGCVVWSNDRYIFGIDAITPNYLY